MDCEFDQYNRNHPCYSSYHLDFVIARLLNFLSSAGWIMRIGSADLSRFPNLTSIGNNSMAFRDHVPQCGFSINCYVMTTCLKRSIHHPNTPVFIKHRRSKFIIKTRLFKLVVWVVKFVFGLCWMLFRFMNTKVHAIHSKQKDGMSSWMKSGRPVVQRCGQTIFTKMVQWQDQPGHPQMLFL